MPLAATKIATTSVDDQTNDVPFSLEERKTEELVIGLVGAVGSGVSTTAQKFAEILKRRYKYDCRIIKLSG